MERPPCRTFRTSRRSGALVVHPESRDLSRLLARIHSIPLPRKSKQEQVQRYLQQSKKVRSRDEQKALDQHVAAHKATRKKTKRRRREDWLETADESFDTERIARAPAIGRGVPTAATPGVDAELAAAASALVVGVDRDRLRVRSGANDAEQIAHLPPASTLSVAVGDRVLLEERDGESVRIAAALPRTSVLSRPDPARPDRERVLAANVDHAIIVSSLRRPAFRPRLIDRYLVAVERGGVRPVVCAHKTDLLEDPAARAAIERDLAPYRALGVPCFFTSVETGEGVEDVRAELTGSTAVLVGQSGVGKSSLLNALFPELDVRTGAVRAGDGKGRHTTTSSRLFELEDGTRLIDTPGVRSFGLYAVDGPSLRTYFPDLQALAEDCRFRDCSHRHEPQCAVRARAESDPVVRARHDAYLRIFASLEDPG